MPEGSYPKVVFPLDGFTHTADLLFSGASDAFLDILWSGTKHESTILARPDSFSTHAQLKQHRPYCPDVIGHIIHGRHLPRPHVVNELRGGIGGCVRSILQVLCMLTSLLAHGDRLASDRVTGRPRQGSTWAEKQASWQRDRQSCADMDFAMKAASICLLCTTKTLTTSRFVHCWASQILTFMVCSAACKVYKGDLYCTILPGHHDVCRLDVSVTPLLVHVQHDLNNSTQTVSCMQEAFD